MGKLIRIGDHLFLIPFTLKFHIFNAVFFNVITVIKAGSVGQIHKQTHLDLQIRKKGFIVYRQ